VLPANWTVFVFLLLMADFRGFLDFSDVSPSIDADSCAELA
jgi:hypothetical protein